MHPALDARLAHVTATLRAAGCVFAEEEAALLIGAASSSAHLASMIDQRVSGLPLEPIVGFAEFCGLRIHVDPGVFVPRRRTEFLVQQAVSRATPDAVVLDLCCGSGAIGVAVAAGIAANSPGSVELHAADVEPAAVHCTRRNVEPIGGHAYLGDLYEPLPAGLRGRVDLMLANAPYVPTDAIELMPREARLYEPLVTLDGGVDGVQVHRRVAAEAPGWLVPGGNLLIETSEQQAVATAEAVADSGLRVEVVSSQDWACTVVVGTRVVGTSDGGTSS